MKTVLTAEVYKFPHIHV